MSTEHIILAGVIFFVAHFVSTVTGFGSNVLGLPLLALVVGLAPGKQSLIVLGAILYVYLTLRWWKHVDVPQLIWITLVAGIGLFVGMKLFQILPRRSSTIVLAVFVIGVGIRGLLKVAPRYRAPMWATQILLFVGGVVHGAFTTGGPLLTVYCRRTLRDKSVFRATLALMWILLALGLCIGWTVSHTWDPATPRVMMLGLPFSIGGLIAGEYVHHKVDERAFFGAVNLTLIAVGAVLLLSAH